MSKRTGDLYCVRLIIAIIQDRKVVGNYYGNKTLKKHVPYLLNILPEVIEREAKTAKTGELFINILLSSSLTDLHYLCR